LGDRKIKYFASGEYGEKFGRPHYHLFVFGVKYSDKELIQKCWEFGNVDVEIPKDGFKASRYVAGYIKKDGVLGRSRVDGRTLPFQLQSTGIGKAYAEKHKERLIKNLGSTINGVQVGLPRYYRRILEIDPERIAEKSKEKAVKQLQVHAERVGGQDELILDSVKNSRIQKETDFKKNLALRGKVRNID